MGEAYLLFKLTQFWKDKSNLSRIQQSGIFITMIVWLNIHAKLNSFKAVCMIVSLTAQNTSLMFSVSG